MYPIPNEKHKDKGIFYRLTESKKLISYNLFVNSTSE